MIGQFRLDLLALGHIGDESMPQRATIGLPFRQGITKQPTHSSILETNPILVAPRRQCFSRALDGGNDSRVVIGMQDGMDS